LKLDTTLLRNGFAVEKLARLAACPQMAGTTHMIFCYNIFNLLPVK
jgi:hypothetical protein